MVQGSLWTFHHENSMGYQPSPRKICQHKTQVPHRHSSAVSLRGNIYASCCCCRVCCFVCLCVQRHTSHCLQTQLINYVPCCVHISKMLQLHDGTHYKYSAGSSQIVQDKHAQQGCVIITKPIIYLPFLVLIIYQQISCFYNIKIPTVIDVIH